MSHTKAMHAYRDNKIRDVAERDKGALCNLGHHGVYLRAHAAPPPDAAEYDRWLNSNAPAKKNGIRSRGFNMTGAKLRRVVLMRRQGSTQAECGIALGVKASAIALWLSKLPAELRP